MAVVKAATEGYEEKFHEAHFLSKTLMLKGHSILLHGLT